MQIAVHLGAHCTDDGRLVRSLIRSRGDLLNHGVIASPPRQYRALLRETLSILNDTVATREVQDLLMDTLVDDEATHRMVLFHEHLICTPQRSITEEGIYPLAGRRIAAFAKLFPDHECEFHLALCNPATMAPTLVNRAGPDGYNVVMAGANISHQRWLPAVRNIIVANPGVSLTVWCNEDTPLIWPEVLRALTGIGPEVPLEGDQDLLNALLSDEGTQYLAEALQGIAQDDLPQRRAAYSKALKMHALPEELEIEVDLPGWTNELIDSITETYISDCAAIAKLPGIRFLTP